jgi:hypothetical protein
MCFQRREQQRWVFKAVSSPDGFPILYDLIGNHNIRSNYFYGGLANVHRVVGGFMCKMYQQHH